MTPWLWKPICFLFGHQTVKQVKIHRKRVVGMHRAYCRRCHKVLWITYPPE
jgi:hypothetical protein